MALASGAQLTGHPWVLQCGLHEEKPILDVNAMSEDDKVAYEEQHYLYIAVELGHLYFIPKTVHGIAQGPDTDKVLRTGQRFHITLAYLPVSQRETAATIQERLQRAIDEWMRLRDRPLERPMNAALVWHRWVYHLDSAEDREHMSRCHKSPISKFSPQELFDLAEENRVAVKNVPDKIADLKLPDQMKELQRYHWSRVREETEEELRVTNWLTGTNICDTMVGVSLWGGSVGHIAQRSEVRSLCRYMLSCIRTNCRLRLLKKVNSRHKLVTDEQMHASFYHLVKTIGGMGFPTVELSDKPWDAEDRENRERVFTSEGCIAPPVRLITGWPSFASLSQAQR